ncbi:MAG: hypothetical protein AAFZ15_27630 [Bacteroidota bacterium]
MEKSKLIQMLKKLNSVEFLDFGKYIYSPYFNNNQKVRELYDYLSKSGPELKGRQLAKINVWKKLYPEADYQAKTMNNLMSLMVGLLRDFMTIETLTKDKTLFKFAEMMALYHRNNYGHFLQASTQLENILAESEMISSTHYLMEYFIRSYSYYNVESDKKPPAGNHLIFAEESLEKFYMLSKLKLICELQIRKRIFSDRENRAHMEVPEKPKEKYIDDHLIGIYSSLVSLQQTNDEAQLESIQNRFFNYSSLFPKSERYVILHALINHISFIYQSGRPELVKNLLKLYKMGLDEGIFIYLNKIRHSTFLNICLACAATNEFDYAERFILAYKDCLEPKIKKETLALARAYICFHQHEFSVSLDYLNSLGNKKQPEFDFRIRNLEIRNHFELALKDPSVWSLVFDKLNAFEKYLNRSKTISKQKTVGYLNFVKATKRLADIVVHKPLTAADKIDLFKRLRANKIIVSVHWLEKKIKEGGKPPLNGH